ncbi:MAG: hypothetical protein U9O98_06945 [Asgard group archaeon]|nr:hypothetical protein [Asgard group archaeon]
MVEPPRLQVQLDARQNAIPASFEEICSKDNFELKIILPKKEKDPKPGPSKRPTYRILDNSGGLIAYFNPWGNAEYYNENFKPFFDKMVKKIEQAAAKALEKFKEQK